MIDTNKLITHLTERRKDWKDKLEHILTGLDNQEQLAGALLTKSEKYEQQVNLIRPFIIGIRQEKKREDWWARAKRNIGNTGTQIRNIFRSSRQKEKLTRGPTTREYMNRFLDPPLLPEPLIKRLRSVESAGNLKKVIPKKVYEYMKSNEFSVLLQYTRLLKSTTFHNCADIYRKCPSQDIQEVFIRNLREIISFRNKYNFGLEGLQEKYSHYNSLLSKLQGKNEESFFEWLQSIYAARNYDIEHLGVILKDLNPLLKAEIDELIVEIKTSKVEFEKRFATIDAYITQFQRYKEQQFVRQLGLTQIMVYAINKLRFLKYPDRGVWVKVFEYYKKANKNWLQKDKLVIEAFKRYGGLNNENANLIFDSYIEEYDRFIGPKKIRPLLRMRYFVLRGDKWGHIARLRHRVEHGGLGLTMNDIRKKFRKERFMEKNKPSQEEVNEFIKQVYEEVNSILDDKITIIL